MPSLHRQYQDARGANSCKQCSLGYYSPYPYTKECTSCRAGRYTDLVGQTVCTNCTAGQWSFTVSPHAPLLVSPSALEPSTHSPSVMLLLFCFPATVFLLVLPMPGRIIQHIWQTHMQVLQQWLLFPNPWLCELYSLRCWAVQSL